MVEHDRPRLFVATDGSPAAVAATRCAVELASDCGGFLRVVTVGEIDARPLTRGRADLERSLAHAVRLGTEAGVETTSAIVEGDGRDTYDAILAAATDWGADLLFVGRTGRHGPGRAMMGSQAEHVLEFSDIPVVVVPPAHGRRP